MCRIQVQRVTSPQGKIRLGEAKRVTGRGLSGRGEWGGGARQRPKPQACLGTEQAQREAAG